MVRLLTTWPTAIPTGSSFSTRRPLAHDRVVGSGDPMGQIVMVVQAEDAHAQVKQALFTIEACPVG